MTSVNMSSASVTSANGAANDPDAFNPHSPEFLANPYPAYATMRERAPVSFVRGYESWWVFRYADVKRVLDEQDLFLKNSPNPSMPPGPFDVLAYMPQGLFSLDPPEHDRQRAIIDPLFKQSIAQADEFAAQLARDLLVKAKASRRIELVNAFALPLPAAVLMTVMGIPRGDQAGVGQWVGSIVAGHDIAAPFALQAAAGTCAMALGAFFQALMRAPACPAHDPGLLGRMTQQGVEQGLMREDVQQTAVNFAVAGYMSTVFLIATGTLNLLRNADQLSRLRDDDRLMQGAIEEMLRYDAPAQLADRYAARDTELGGVKLRRGDKVTAVLGSANRDPDIFADPDRFDIGRAEGTRLGELHLGFGDGIHYCIGAPLVRLVAPVAFRALLAELPQMRLEGLVQWQTDPYLRSVSNLPLAIG